MPLLVSDPLPPFQASSSTNPAYVFDTAAGRYLLLAVLSGGDDEAVARGVAQLNAGRAGFDDVHVSAFCVLPDTSEWRSRVSDQLPGLRWLFDTTGVREKIGVDAAPVWLLIDPDMRVMAMVPPDRADQLIADIRRLPPPERHAGPTSFAPVMVLPRLFEPSFCKALMDHYEGVGGEVSGFMREVGGMTRLITDFGHKRRSDVNIEDEPLKAAARMRITRRLVPQIAKVFQFHVTRMERYLVACYDAETGGYFRPHRDNTTKGTAHRRFAVSINLNADFDGGDLRFSEFGMQTYRPPPGGAVVFSCSLLHEATPVTRGRRFAFLPFLYDEAAAHVRQENAKFLDFGAGAPAEKERVETGVKP